MKKILKTLLTGFENTIVILAIPFIFMIATFLQLIDEMEED